VPAVRGRAVRPLRTRIASRRRRIVPLTPERWPDLERLFGAKGACAGCWCMWMRLPAPEFQRSKGAGNRRALRALVAHRPPGLIAYVAGEAVGWVAVAPRDEFRRLANSRVLGPVPGERVWAAPCFFIKPSHRGAGLGVELLEAAAAFARRSGAHSVEGYPTANRAERQPPAFVYTGFESTFRRAGFTEVARRSPTRPILRRELAPRSPASITATGGRTSRTTKAHKRG
jgi:GNAT superfamily N-acetyltransferase